jgi:hypothetical protein
MGHGKAFKSERLKRSLNPLFRISLALFLFLPATIFAEEEFEALNRDTLNNPSAQAFKASPESLDEAVAMLATELVQQGNLRGRPVLISANDLYESQSRLSLPLAIQLRGKLITEMKQRGCRVLLPGADTENAMILQGTWQRQGDALRIDLKVMKIGPSGPEAAASASQSLPLKMIDKASLTPDRESWARYLVRKLETNAMNPARRTIHMSDFQIKGKAGSDDLGAYLAGWIRPALSESRMFLPLDQQEALKGLSVASLRTRGTRAFRPVAAKSGETSSLTADLLKADGEMKGSAWLHEKKVEVRIRIADPQGQQFSAATADVPTDLFPQYLLEAPATNPGQSEKSSHPSAGAISKDGLQVELTTTRGEARPFYRNGEHIKFVIRLNRSAFIYLFDLDPKGNAILLYPVGDNGQLARGGQCGAMPQASVPIILPEDGCSYDLVVTEPYGTDRVWVVAAESHLEFPADLEGHWSKAGELVTRLRTQGLSGQGGYAEAQVEVVTGP